MSKELCGLVERTCTRTGETEQKTLDFYRNQRAYVLLGESGAGKTTVFKKEADESDGEYITARDFITGIKINPHKPLFIDALDEARTMGVEARKVLDEIRSRLSQLGPASKFRISCRAADWLGESDARALSMLMGEEIVVLHLNPLTPKNIHEILKSKGILNPSDFMDQAKRNRLEDLLTNPQILDLLITAFTAFKDTNTWPQSRTEIYQIACEQLIKEENSEHPYGSQHPLSKETALQCAGYLCAIQLLSGMAGFSLDNRTKYPYIQLNEITDWDLSSLRTVLKTNIFKHDDKLIGRIPIHRSVAEYLGARYLAASITKLPLSRVLALMPDEVGIVASDLRGLNAWLAAHLLTGSYERQILIERDPLGVAIYGDLYNFQTPEKISLLRSLQHRIQYQDWSYYEENSVGGLGTTDLMPEFKKMLSSPPYEPHHQVFLKIVLDAIRYGTPMPALIDLLQAIVRDKHYWSSTRALAVESIEHHSNTSAILKKLADDICAGGIEDLDNHVLDTLLNKLYPTIVPPEKILNYLRPRKSSHAYSAFWNSIADTKLDAYPILLDRLAQIPHALRHTPHSQHIYRWIEKILENGLETYGHSLPIERLYNWLGVGIDEHGASAVDKEAAEKITTWLIHHPEQYQSLIEYGAYLCTTEQDFRSYGWAYRQRVQGAPLPPDMDNWFLEKAKLAVDKHEELAKFYFDEAAHIAKKKDKLALLKTRISDNPLFQKWYEDFIKSANKNYQTEQKYLLESDKRKSQQEQRKSDWIKRYRENINAIQTGDAPLNILYELEMAYNGHFIEAPGDTPEQRLENFLNNDKALIATAYLGFKNALNRHDLPTADEIIKIELDNKRHRLNPVCLIGVNALYKTNPFNVLQLDDRILSSLLAFHFTTDGGEQDEASWVGALANDRPEFVAENFLRYATSMLGAKKEYIRGLHRFTRNGPYASLTNIVFPELLKKFPALATRALLVNVLEPLLKGAITEKLDKDLLLSIVKTKRQNRTIRDTQKIYWLACGFIIAPEIYTTTLRQYIQRNQIHSHDLADFLYGGWSMPLFCSLNEKVIGLLIELIAPDCTPERSLEGGLVTQAMQTTDLVHELIRVLQENGKDTDELDRLLKLENLTPWRPILDNALHIKRLNLAKAKFQHVTVKEICHTLANAAPANPADLAALTVEYLKEIRNQIRHDENNIYNIYWNGDKPKPENDCRDILLPFLNQHLSRWGLHGNKEASYVNDTRADIKIPLINIPFKNKNSNIPIEIKLESNRKLWRAIDQQLISKYVSDPNTGGYGIYIVFWFGVKLQKPPVGIPIPNSPSELEEQLRQTLTEKYKSSIHICVIDCSRPN